MTIIQAVILGIIQGLTEMLPISSSAHLNVIPWIFGWLDNPTFFEEFNTHFDVALHFGTLVAIVLFFIKDWLSLFKAGMMKIIKKENSVEGSMFWSIVAATIPAGILAIGLDYVSELIIGDNIKVKMGVIAFSLIVMGIILEIVDRKAENKYEFKDISFKQAMLIGMSQAIAAAFPGVSRSGITISVSRFLKIDRESAARFSFLLSTPMVAAAVLVCAASFLHL